MTNIFLIINIILIDHFILLTNKINTLIYLNNICDLKILTNKSILKKVNTKFTKVRTSKKK